MLRSLAASHRAGAGNQERSLRSTNRRWRYDNLYKSGRDVVDEAGNKPPARQCGNRSERSNVHGDGSAAFGDRFGLEALVRYLKIVRQQGWVVGEARHSAIGVLKYYQVELPAASRNRSGNLADRPVDPTAPTVPE